MPRSTGGLKFAAAVPLVAHACLLSFTSLLVLKLSGRLPLSWWWVFAPLYCFHAVVARCKCSMPAVNTPHDRQWAPCHTVVLTPLLLSFEVLLCCYLAAVEGGGKAPVRLEVVFLPLFVLQGIILADNFRMCMVLMPGEDDNMTDEALWETLPHFAVAVSMVFFLAATMFSVLKLSGTVDVLDWWDLLVNFCIGEFFAFLLCVKWTNPYLLVRAPSNTAAAAAPLLGGGADGGGGGGLPSSGTNDPGAQSGGDSSADAAAEAASPRSQGSDSSGASDEESAELACGLPEIGGHLIKGGLVVFQVLLCMRLEGEPEWAAKMSVELLFLPLLVMQAGALLSAGVHLAEAALLLYSADLGARVAAFTKENDPCSFLTSGMRLAGWWTIDEEAREERRGLSSALFPGYSTFDPTPMEHVKKMRKAELTEEVARLQAALMEQSESSKTQHQELDRIQQEKLLCRVCFEREISIVLMPCRHRVLCQLCADKCKHCPICRSAILERMVVFDV